MIDAHVRWHEHVTEADLLADLDLHGVERALLGPVDRWAAVDNREGNDAVLALVGRHPERLGGWAVANPWRGRRAADDLRRALDAGLLGLKVIPHQQGHSLLQPGLLEPLLDLAAERHAPAYVVTGLPIASEPLQVTELARRWPEVPFVMGRSGRTDFALDLHPALGGAPNIYAETAHNGSGELDAVVKGIGAERLLFASDWPENDLGLELRRARQVRLDPAQKDLVFGGNLARICSWEST